MKRVLDVRDGCRRRLVAAATLAVMLGLVAAAPAQEQRPGGDTASPSRSFLGFLQCVRCHVQAPKTIVIDNLPLQFADDQWILYSELLTWGQQDKHFQAYTVLLNKRSKRMAKLLGIKAAHRDKRCLSCHTGYPIDQMTTGDDGLVTAAWFSQANVNRGITCEGCHGPAGNPAGSGAAAAARGWFQPHQVPPLPPFEKTRPWRFLDPKQKWEQYGYVDVRTPSNKARLCGSCHIGDAAKGRVVTHDIYAAGHPPLPGFELATFAGLMPAHWRSVAEKPKQVRDVFLANTRDPYFSSKAYRLDGLHRTRSMLVAAIVSLAQYLELTAGLCAQPTNWPEMAQFECYACHHDLRTPAWRQRRRPPGGAPGRPALREWTTVLARVALSDPPGSQVFDQHWQQVRDELRSVPFGRPVKLAEYASTTAGWLMEQARQLERTPLDRKRGQAILLAVARAGASGSLDYDATRQLVWACRVIGAELGPDNSPAVKEQLKALAATGFVLDFPRRPKADVLFPGEEKPRKMVELDLARLLPPIGEYNPGKARQVFAAMADALEKQVTP